MAEQKTGPQYDPQPGDVQTWTGDRAPHYRQMTECLSRDGDTLYVKHTQFDGATKEEETAIHTWSWDVGGTWTYTRPVAEAPAPAPSGPQYDPQPGDTMTYAHDEDVYTVTSTDANSVTCTVRLPRTNWSDAGDGEWVYAPGTGHVPDDVEPCADVLRLRLAHARGDADASRADLDVARAEAEAARADAEVARAQADSALAVADKAVALAERVTGHLAASEAFATTAALYLTACRAVMSPDQHAVVEILVGLAPRA